MGHLSQRKESVMLLLPYFFLWMTKRKLLFDNKDMQINLLSNFPYCHFIGILSNRLFRSAIKQLVEAEIPSLDDFLFHEIDQKSDSSHALGNTDKTF